MHELGKSLVINRGDFVDMLRNAGVGANASMSDSQLINLFVDNVGNKQVLVGAAFLCNVHNKSVGFDGEEEVSNEGTQAAYKAISTYWGDYSFAEGTSNGSGILGSVVEGGLGITNKLLDSKNKSKNGALDALTAQNDAKSQMAQSVIQARQSQVDNLAKDKAAKAKNVKIAIIAGGSLLLVGLAVGVYLYIKKRKK